MTSAAPSKHAANRIGDFDDVETDLFDPAPPHVRGVDEETCESPSVFAFQAIADLLGERHDVDELLTRIDALEQQIGLLQQRDATLSRTVRKIDEEQRLAARIQHDFLPKQMPRLGAISFQAIYRPAHYVSGDLYDVKRLDETNVGIYIADAVGHGMPAALLTMFMKNALATKRILPAGYELLPPGETIAALNAALRSENLDHSSFATALYARIDCTTNRVSFARGGHPNPLVLRADGTVEELTADGPLLGVFDDAEWAEASAQLHPGDRLFLYTDGVEVACAGDSDTPDTQAWRDQLLDHRALSTVDLLRRFTRTIEEDRAGLPPDDLTIVVAEIAR